MDLMGMFNEIKKDTKSEADKAESLKRDAEIKEIMAAIAWQLMTGTDYKTHEPLENKKAKPWG